MKLGNYDMDCDIVATQKYRDYYNEKCECEESGNSRNNFNYRNDSTIGWFSYHPIDVSLEI